MTAFFYHNFAPPGLCPYFLIQTRSIASLPLISQIFSLPNLPISFSNSSSSPQSISINLLFQFFFPSSSITQSPIHICALSRGRVLMTAFFYHNFALPGLCPYFFNTDAKHRVSTAHFSNLFSSQSPFSIPLLPHNQSLLISFSNSSFLLPHSPIHPFTQSPIHAFSHSRIHAFSHSRILHGPIISLT